MLSLASAGSSASVGFFREGMRCHDRRNRARTIRDHGTYVGKRFDGEVFTFATIETPSYFVLDLFAAYDINETFRIFGRIENALDRDFEEPDGFAQPGIGGFVGIRGIF